MPRAFLSRHFWNGAAPLMVCPQGARSICKTAPCSQGSNEYCYQWTLSRNHSQTTNELVACQLSQAVCNRRSCEGYKRLVDAAR